MGQPGGFKTKADAPAGTSRAAVGLGRVTGQPQPLTSRERELLAFFLVHPNEFFTTPELQDLARLEGECSPEGVRQSISDLGRKLKGHEIMWRLVRQRHRGYCLLLTN